MKAKNERPAWICDDCAKKNGGVWPEGHLGTFHNDYCGWCGEFKTVTEPRDWLIYGNKN